MMVRNTLISKAVIVLVCLNLAAQAFAASTGPLLPSELFTFDKLSQEVRGQIGLKLQDMIRSFGPKEKEPGHLIIFRDKNGRTRMSLTYERNLSILTTGKSLRKETVLIKNENGVVILSESIETVGTNLQYTLPRTRVYFEGDLNYGLDDGEDSKKVTITSNGQEFFRFESSSGVSSSGGFAISNNMYLGGAPVLNITDSSDSMGTSRYLNYRVSPGSFNLHTIGYDRNFDGWKIEPFRIEAVKPPGYIIENYRYFQGNKEIYGLNNFLVAFSNNIFKKFIVGGIDDAISHIAGNLFPPTEVFQDVTLRSQFLTDLQFIQSQTQQAKTNPALLTQISSLVLKLIVALREGKLKVTDLRPSGGSTQ